MHVTLAIWLGVLAAGQESEADVPRLEMSEPILCRVIRGFEDYEPLPEPVVVRTEKFLIYTRPMNHEYVRERGGYRFKLAQDVEVRRKGQKKVLWGRRRIVEYEATSPEPPLRLYIGTSLGLKEFPAGEYEADLFLHDEIAGGKPTMRTVTFRLIDPPKDDTSPTRGAGAPVRTPASPGPARP